MPTCTRSASTPLGCSITIRLFRATCSCSVTPHDSTGAEQDADRGHVGERLAQFRGFGIQWPGAEGEGTDSLQAQPHRIACTREPSRHARGGPPRLGEVGREPGRNGRARASGTRLDSGTRASIGRCGDKIQVANRFRQQNPARGDAEQLDTVLGQRIQEFNVSKSDSRVSATLTKARHASLSEGLIGLPSLVLVLGVLSLVCCRGGAGPRGDAERTLVTAPVWPRVRA